jgi:hypothetical protein
MPRNQNDAPPPGDGEILFEFLRMGKFMKAIAMDANTGTEVSVFGPAKGCNELLKRTAVSKLRMVMSKEAAKNGR